MWEQNKQFGHFVDNASGHLRLGGSASAGLAPAGLVWAWRRWRDPRHLEVACASGTAFRNQFTLQGLTTGGPSDALQAPDSESAYALLESYLALHEATRDALWLGAAQDAANQLATWVMPYDYPFPPGSEFGRLGMRTAGTVWANAQNKHSAPGICTHSWQGLLRLARATGDFRYLSLLGQVCRRFSSPQTPF